HGALSPETVLISGRGPRKTAKLVDWGLAPLGVRIQSPRHAAPEVLEGHAADRRADLWSLRALLYAVATRSPPFPGDNGEQLRAEQGTPLVPPRDRRKTVPKAVDELIRELLARDPASRPASANGLIRELNKVAGKRFSIEPEAKLAQALAPKLVGREDDLADL